MSKTLVALILRHGESNANAANVFRSRLDPSLTDKGLKQAEDAASFISDNFKITRIISSPMLRAMQTADAVADVLGLPITQDRGLMCWNLGFLSGRDRETYGPILEMYVDNPELEIPDGESLEYFTKRTQAFFEENLMLVSDENKHEYQPEGASGAWTVYAPATQPVTLFVCHTSNLVCLENIVVDNPEGRPESGEAAVGTGGIAAVYADGEDLVVEPVYGVEHPANFGS
jgi:hypothetical protein